MRILAIETSCDDTCIALIKTSGKTNPCFNILSNVVSSQVEIHRKWGGVYPTLAKREHQKNLVTVLIQALKKAGRLKKSKKPTLRTQQIKNQKIKHILEREEVLYKKLKAFLEKYQKPNIDLIAVTVGPGLEPCLWVGINFAKALSYFWELPIIPVNHIEAHILANFIDQNQVSIKFPALCLVVSGGHTQLILMKDFGKYKILGETRDDAAGECFDKVARILGLGYPGGPIISNLASMYRERFSVHLPRPMINQKNYDFSFSGLKTAVLYNFRNQPPRIRKAKKYIQEMSAEVQQAIIDVLIHKTLRAAKDFKVKTIILGGGVVANKELREQFKKRIKTEIPNTKYLIPDTKYCTDNAAIIGTAAAIHYPESKTPWQKIGAEANLRL